MKFVFLKLQGSIHLQVHVKLIFTFSKMFWSETTQESNENTEVL